MVIAGRWGILGLFIFWSIEPDFLSADDSYNGKSHV